MTDIEAPGPRSGPGSAVQTCFHCHEPVPAGFVAKVTINGREEPMCCPGCEAVARAIVDYGLERYYRMRSAEPARPEPLLPEELRRQSAFDDPQIQEHFVDRPDGAGRSTRLILEGVTCPACCWLVEQRLGGLDGVQSVDVNYTTQRASVTWDPDRVSLSGILRGIAQLGYRAQPYSVSTQSRLLESDRRVQLRRLGIAALLGAQVMMISVALYFGDWWGMQEIYRRFFELVALVLTVPIVFYSGQPFFRGAWRDFRNLRPGMDVPVSLGIGIAMVGSVFATVTGTGPVYYDSVAMFILFLLVGRYVEFSVRRRAALQLDRLQRIIPAVATRLVDGEQEQVAVARLRVGDVVLVRPGETIPADGEIVDGDTSVNESLITGESLPVTRRINDRVIGGSLNVDSPVQVRIDRVGGDTLLSFITKLAGECQSGKPAVMRVTSRISTWFVSAVLLAALLVAWYWYHVDASRWLPVTVSVLVVTCPCALALAAPTALAAATAALMRVGVVPVNGDALETLARSTLFVFDKTGTLTRGELQLSSVMPLAELDGNRVLALAAELENASEHPLAKAVLLAAGKSGSATVRKLRNYPGAGVIGEIDGHEYAVGSAAFISGQYGLNVGASPAHSDAQVRFYLADPSRLLGAFTFSDPVREEAESVIRELRREGIRTMLLSGDSEWQVNELSRQLHVDSARAGQKPEDKAAVLRELMAAGETVCMVGDGINDAPVLAAANVSAAMGNATDLAQSSADLILPGGLNALLRARKLARRTMRVMRQNLAWALGYNLVFVPFAAAGYLAPWMAALGMSMSSILVVANSTRIGRVV